MKTYFTSSKNALLGFIVSLVIVIPNISKAQSVNTFIFTGAAEFFTVPAGVTSIFVTATGAGGGCDTLGGAGAEVCDSIPVTPGMMIQVNVGGAGVDTIGGYNGGGAGGNSILPANIACGGGGASDVRVPPYGLGDRVLVAGGGGGKGGGSAAQSAGGDAECPDGANGANGFANGGTGATTTTFGLGGSLWGAGVMGLNGSLGQGGNGVADTCFNLSPGGGGGGGWYGGGSGAADCFNGASSGGGGGGGSSYYSVNGCCTPGVGFGNGSVVISYLAIAVGLTEQPSLKPQVTVDEQSTQITILAKGEFTFEIYSVNGQLLQSGYGYDNKSIPKADLKTGLYLVRIIQKQEETVVKIKL